MSDASENPTQPDYTTAIPGSDFETFSSADELVLRDDHRDLNDSGTGEITKKSSRREDNVRY